MTDRMIMSSDGEITFMYRVGGVAILNERLLVEHNVRHGFCFVPGGRVEYGENAIEALAREFREELGEDVEVGRLFLSADNLFELDGKRYQEIVPYFLMDLVADSSLYAREGIFEGDEPGSAFQWIELSELDRANLFPPFLSGRLQSIPETPEHIVHSDFAKPSPIRQGSRTDPRRASQVPSP